jgi:hypothetical protein
VIKVNSTSLVAETILLENMDVSASCIKMETKARSFRGVKFWSTSPPKQGFSLKKFKRKNISRTWEDLEKED